MTQLESQILHAAYNGGQYRAIKHCSTPLPRFRWQLAVQKSWLQIGALRIDGEADVFDECLRNLESKNLLLDVGESRWILPEDAKDRLGERT